MDLRHAAPSWCITSGVRQGSVNVAVVTNDLCSLLSYVKPSPKTTAA